jgi:LysM repeat protein
MKTKKTKNESLLLRLIDGDRHKHRVALVTDEGEWNQHEPNTGMARMFVIMLLIHVVLIGGIIVYDFMSEEEAPAQAVTQAARATGASGTSGLPQASEEVLNAQASAVANPVADTETYTVSSGDSIRSIAEKHGISEETLIQMNMLDKGIQIGPGTLLNVPKTPVPAAIAISREDAEKMATRDQPPGNPVKVEDAPASIGASTNAISLLAPGEAAPSGNSLVASAEAPAIATPAAGEEVQRIEAASNPQAIALLAEAAQENARIAEAAKELPAAEVEAAPAIKTPERAAPPAPVEEPKPVVRAEPKPEPKKAVKPESKPLVKPNPVPTPSQMSRRIAETPPAPKKSTPKSATKSSAPKATAAKTHTLASGETLYRLSAKYGVSVAAIQKANNIKNPNSMREGMKLVIPAK